MTPEEINLQMALQKKRTSKIALDILEAGRAGAGDPNINTFVLLEMIIIGVIATLADPQDDQKVIDHLIDGVKKHLPKLRRMMAEEGLVKPGSSDAVN